MNHLVETNLHQGDRDLFELYLHLTGLDTVSVSVVEGRSGVKKLNKICYAYSDDDSYITEIISFLTLKYGSLEKAYIKYLDELDNSCIGDIC
jgi:hypothetical protein